MASVSIQLLGGFAVTVDGVRTGIDGFTRRGGAELIQLLALTPGHRLHREQVFDALWPETDPEKAVGILYRSATAARKVLGSTDSISLAGESVALLPGEPPAIDVDLVGNVDPENPEEVAAAIAAYRGDLLPGALYAEWTTVRREEVRQTYLHLLARAGRWRTIVELDPTNEDAHVVLMQEALDQGDRQGALKRFDLLQRTMLDELGTEPGPTAVAVRDEARSATPSGTPAASGLRAFVATRWDPGSGEQTTMVSTAIEQFGGSIFDRGETGLDAVFPSAATAIEAALACQRATQTGLQFDTGQPEPEPNHELALVNLRVGVDAGEAERNADGWTGAATARAAAIGEVAASGQVVCSTSAAELAGSLLDNEIELVSLGLFRLPDLPPMSLHRIKAAGLDDRPKPLRVGPIDGRPVRRQHAAIFGRDEEVETLTGLLRLQRLVTVVGPGGAGKTHLAEHVATRLGDDFPGGAWMAGLGAISEAADVGAEVLAAVGGHRHTDTTTTESIVRTVGDQSTLIVLDNCEHVTETARELTATLLDRCPGLRILATSREPLGVASETLQPIGQLTRAAAVELFQSEAARHAVTVDPDDETVDRICERLDDLPLAIRLAAARTRTLGLEELETMLAERLDLLRAVDQPSLAHHQTLRSAISWSVDALAEGPRRLLIDLAAFANRFTLEGALAIGGGSGLGKGELLDNFDELVRRSLVAGPERVDGEALYRLLESVRLYAAELAENSEAADRHLSYFADRADRFDRMLRNESDEALAGFRVDWEDLRLARAHAAATGQMDRLTELFGSVAGFSIELLWFEYLDWVLASFDIDNDEIVGRAKARLTSAAALMLAYRGEMERATELSKRTFAACDADDITLYVRGWTQSMMFEGDEGRANAEAILLDPDRTFGPMRCAALANLAFLDELNGIDSSPRVHELAVLAATSGDLYRAAHLDAVAGSMMDSAPARAAEAFEESVGIADRIGHRPLSLGGRGGLATLAVANGSDRDALVACRNALVWPLDNGILTSMPQNISRAAKVLTRLGRLDIAVTILAAITEFHPESAGDPARIEQVDALRAAAPELFDSWWATGTKLDAVTAARLAVRTLDECETQL